MSIIKSLITFLLIISIAGFCMLNAQKIDITWSPIHDPVSIPLYALILSTLTFGFIIGACVLWINSGTLRKTKRQQKKQIQTLEKELSKASDNTNNQKPPADFFPALPNQNS